MENLPLGFVRCVVRISVVIFVVALLLLLFWDAIMYALGYDSRICVWHGDDAKLRYIQDGYLNDANGGPGELVKVFQDGSDMVAVACNIRDYDLSMVYPQFVYMDACGLGKPVRIKAYVRINWISHILGRLIIVVMALALFLALWGVVLSKVPAFCDMLKKPIDQGMR